MRYLYFDTETTGKLAWRKPLADQSQPTMVQFAAILSDGQREIHACHFIVDPKDVIIPDEAARIHGITTDFAKAHGVPIEMVLAVWQHLVQFADVVIAHNLEFDISIMQIAALRAKQSLVMPRETFCTMKEATDILNLPSASGRDTPKWPSLVECMRFFFSEDLDRAHNAMVDAQACMRVHQAILLTRSEEIVF